MFIFPTTAYRVFTQKLTKQARLKVGRVEIKRFSDGEIYVRVGERVMGKKVSVVGTTAPPAENLVELLLLVNALKTARARHVTAIIPYFGYGRADHIVAKGEALSAKLMADLLQCAGVDCVMAVDLHSPRVEKFFKVPVVQIRAQELLAREIAHLRPASTRLGEAGGIPRLRATRFARDDKLWVVVAPDHGALSLARRMAKKLHAPVAWLEKVRPRHNVARVGVLHGDVRGRHTVLMDDIIDTSGTIVAAARHLKARGARSIIAVATHGVLSGSAALLLQEAPIAQVVVTNTFPAVYGRKFKKLKIVAIIPLLIKAIRK